jgi:hypothetical protein
MLNPHRCDLGIALLTGSDHLFFCRPSEPITPFPEKLLGAPDEICFRDQIDLIRSMDSGLAECWQVMRKFCLLANLGTQTQRFMHPELIHGTMVAVTYRLLQMRFSIGSTNEVLRYGLLAFSYHIFLQWKDIRLPYSHFPTIYRSYIQSLKTGGVVSPQLMLWLLITGANSVFNVWDELWLQESLRTHYGHCQVKSWKEMQDILKSFMWIEMLDDEVGKRIYDFLHPRDRKRKTK